MKRLIMVLAVALTACAGTPFKWDSARKIQPGMTTTEVSEIMGPPHTVSSSGDNLRYVWVYVNSFTGTRTLAVDFKDGKVLKAPPIPDSFQ